MLSGRLNLLLSHERQADLRRATEDNRRLGSGRDAGHPGDSPSILGRRPREHPAASGAGLGARPLGAGTRRRDRRAAASRAPARRLSGDRRSVPPRARPRRAAEAQGGTAGGAIGSTDREGRLHQGSARTRGRPVRVSAAGRWLGLEQRGAHHRRRDLAAGRHPVRHPAHEGDARRDAPGNPGEADRRRGQHPQQRRPLLRQRGAGGRDADLRDGSRGRGHARRAAGTTATHCSRTTSGPS